MTERRGDGESGVDAHAPTEAVSGDGTQTGPRSKRGPLSRPSVGRFRIEGPLGSGGMGDVYRAHDSVLDRAVALKVLRSDPGNEDDAQRRRRVVREARAAAALTHPNTVTIFDVGEDGDDVFIAMELLEGEDLRAKLERGDASLNQKLRWLREAARALAAAHERGLVHRDVKPENMFVCKDGTLKLLDFGIAKRGEDEGAALPGDRPADSIGPSSFKTAVGRRFGTPRYMAPEQHAGEPTDPRTDQYAWGLVAFELLTGSLAIDSLPTRTNDDDLGGAAGDVPTARFAELRTRLPELPEAVARLVQRALEPRKDERYPSMKEIVEALEAIDLPDSRRARELEPKPDSDTTMRSPARTAPIETPPPRPKRRMLRWVVGAAIGAAVVGGGALGVRAWRARPAPPLCKLQSSRDLAMARNDAVTIRADGRLVVARRADEKGLRLEREKTSDTWEPQPLPPMMKMVGDFPHRTVELATTRIENEEAVTALFFQDADNDGPGGVIAMAWSETATTTQRLPGPLSGIAMSVFRGTPIVVATTFSNAPRLEKLPNGAELYPLKPRAARVQIEIGGGHWPAIATSGDRLVVAYVGEGGIRVAVLDSEMLRMGDMMVVYDINSAPALVFDGKRISVFWVEEKQGRTRLMTSSIVLGQPSFPPPRVAIDEPVTRFRPTVVPLGKDRTAIAWVTSVGGMSTLRLSPVGPDGSLTGPSDIAKASDMRDVFSTDVLQSPAFVAWTETPGRLRVAEITCAADRR